MRIKEFMQTNPVDDYADRGLHRDISYSNLYGDDCAKNIAGKRLEEAGGGERNSGFVKALSPEKR